MTGNVQPLYSESAGLVGISLGIGKSSEKVQDEVLAK